MHKPVQKADAIGIDIGTDDAVAKRNILVVIQFAKSLAPVIESCTIRKIVFRITSALAGENTVSAHVDNLSVGPFGSLGQEMGEVTIEECRQRMILLGKLIEDTDAVDHAVIVAFPDHFRDGLRIKCIAGKTPDILAFPEIEAIDIMTLLQKV